MPLSSLYSENTPIVQMVEWNAADHADPALGPPWAGLGGRQPLDYACKPFDAGLLRCRPSFVHAWFSMTLAYEYAERHLARFPKQKWLERRAKWRSAFFKIAKCTRGLPCKLRMTTDVEWRSIWS